jgi:Protein of unknown function (DUF3048) N-terminal domain/Protein of unknown function (DUF3048) C-terminal domain
MAIRYWEDGLPLIVRRPLVVLALAVLLVGTACSSSSVPRSVPSPPAPASWPAPAMVQVENAPGVRPHRGLQKADVVFEYLTEGGISRFTVLFWDPSGAFRVEPVRSARLVTVRLVQSYGGVLFYSGASERVQAQIGASGVHGFSESSEGGRCFARDSARAAPHNLYTTADRLHQCLSGLQQTVRYPPPATGEPGKAAETVARFDFSQTVSHRVAYTYAPESRTYTSTDEQGPLTDADNGSQPVAVTNVVLIRVAHHGVGYSEDVNGAEGVDYDLTGSGSADVYSRGGHIVARWDMTQGPLRLLGADGGALPLPAGLTWMHLVDPDTQVTASA